MDKTSRLILTVIFLLFAFGHFYRLGEQEFVGDEAAPILLLTRATDALTLKDWRYLAWPFLWYHDPFRAVFNVGIINLTGAGPGGVEVAQYFFQFSHFLGPLFYF